MRRLGLAFAFLAASLLPVAPAHAVPEAGLYYQPIPGSSGNIQAGTPGGVFQIDYAPVLDRPAAGTMQLLQAALRLPAPLLDNPLKLSGLLGYRHQLAIYSGGPQDSYGSIEAGLSAALSFREVAGRSSPLAALGLYAFGFYDQVILGMAPGLNFSTGGPTMTSFGAGVTLGLPTDGVLVLGYESWAIPTALGTGSGAFGSSIRTFNGLTVGYRW